ncbi:hypothetical protein OEZ85_005551 [Tetradesmus obliquus]|uniref:Uncharacterized protein n=1 Tax=Tetradesmus obliquus TaxID=3088 RepID=A0ABY8UG22_TETOB|nr:hypothetical protein OEZ85_005551 [Tetradesmus obliquus]
MSLACEIGGTYVALGEPLGPPACRVPFTHQGQGRYAHIYLPASYDGATQFPVWVHLHGVFWATMGDIGQLVGKAVNGTDVIPKWDKTVQLFGDRAIIVYPQSLGDPGTGNEANDGQGEKYRQFWSIPFWRCSAGICRPKKLDDAGFIEAVIADLPKRLPMAPGKMLLSGVSAGGMMVETLLCQSPAVAASITAAVDMLGGIASDYAAGPACSSSSAVPFLKLQGTDDPSIAYNRQILVDGVNFLSAIEATQQRAKHNGCSAKDAGPQTIEADGKIECTDYCGKAAGKPAAKICGMIGVVHTTDFPHPGFVFEQAWRFFQQAKPVVAAKPAAARGVPAQKSAKPAVKPAAAAAAQAKAVAAAASHAQGPLQLQMVYPGVTLPEFRANMASKSVAAVAAATSLPANNITATYTEAKPAGRRLLATPEASTGSSSSSSSSAAKKRQQQQQQQSVLCKDVLATSASGCSWNGDDGSSTISGSTSTGNLKSVDVVMHVIEEDAAAAKGGKVFAA